MGGEVIEREKENRVEWEESFRKRQYVVTYKTCRFYFFHFLDYQINYIMEYK